MAATPSANTATNMKSCCGIFSKLLLNLLNVIFVFAGGRLIAYGIDVSDSPNSIRDSAVYLIVVGLILGVAALLSFWGVWKEIRRILIASIVLESILVFLMIGLLVWIKSDANSDTATIILGVGVGVVIIRIGLAAFMAREIRAESHPV